MASNYTEHYQLPIWSPEDSFLREEFNESHQKIDAALGTLSQKFCCGIYEGDGTFGAEHPVTLTFPFTPKAVYLGTMDRTAYAGGWFRYGTSKAYVQYSYSGGGYLELTWDGPTVTFYSKDDASAQFNYSGATFYMAVQ